MAEDEEALREVLTEALRGAGYDVVAVENGRKAIEAALASPFDLLVLDENLPELRGREVVARLRTIDPRVPVLIVSGHLRLSEQEQQALGLRVLEKPFGIDALLEEVRGALG